MLEKSAKMHPNDEVVVGNLADGYRWSGENKKAIDAYDKAISIAYKDLRVNAKNATALGSLGVYFAKKGDASLAAHYIRQARSIDASDVQLIYEEAVIRALANQPDLALESLRSAFEQGTSPEQARLDPEFRNLWTNRAFQNLMSDFLAKPK